MTGARMKCSSCGADTVIRAGDELLLENSLGQRMAATVIEAWPSGALELMMDTGDLIRLEDPREDGTFGFSSKRPPHV